MTESAIHIAAEVRGGRVSAVSVAQHSIALIRERDGAIDVVTRLLEDRALAEARAVDAVVAAGGDPGPLAGVPYGVSFRRFDKTNSVGNTPSLRLRAFARINLLSFSSR